MNKNDLYFLREKLLRRCADLSEDQLIALRQLIYGDVQQIAPERVSQSLLSTISGAKENYLIDADRLTMRVLVDGDLAMFWLMTMTTSTPDDDSVDEWLDLENAEEYLTTEEFVLYGHFISAFPTPDDYAKLAAKG